MGKLGTSKLDVEKIKKLHLQGKNDKEIAVLKELNMKMQKELDVKNQLLSEYDEMFKHLDKLVNMDELNQCSKALASVAFKNTEELLYKLKTKCEKNTEFIKESFNNYWNNQ